MQGQRFSLLLLLPPASVQDEGRRLLLVAIAPSGLPIPPAVVRPEGGGQYNTAFQHDCVKAKISGRLAVNQTNILNAPSPAIFPLERSPLDFRPPPSPSPLAPHLEHSPLDSPPPRPSPPRSLVQPLLLDHPGIDAVDHSVDIALVSRFARLDGGGVRGRACRGRGR